MKRLYVWVVERLINHYEKKLVPVLANWNDDEDFNKQVKYTDIIATLYDILYDINKNY